MGKADEFTTRVFYFEGFTLDVARRTLQRSGAEVDLRAKCFDRLVCLVPRAGRVVTKDELLTTVWSNVVVTDESLTRCVSNIRQALGDADQRSVKTVPRQGYVLAAPVALTDPALAPPQDPSVESAESGDSVGVASVAPLEPWRKQAKCPCSANPTTLC